MRYTVWQMNELSLLAWVAIAAFVFGATVMFMAVSPRTAAFGIGRKLIGGLAIWVAVAMLTLPVMFIPELGIAGFVLSGVGILMAAISYWKWWVLWLPVP